MILTLSYICDYSLPIFSLKIGSFLKGASMTTILFFGEPLVRITPSFYNTVSNDAACKMHFGGSEINIARTMSSLGVTTKLFTGLPATPIGDRFMSFLKQSSIDTSPIQRTGERIGFYYLEEGVGIRNSQVFYDRKNTSISNMTNLNIKDILTDVTHFHFSGITVAISTNVQNILLELLKEAKKKNIIISMDLNLRTKMISIEDAKKQFSKFAKYADICFGIDPLMVNESDTEMFNRDDATITDIKERMQKLQSVFKFTYIFHTHRYTKNQNINTYKAYALYQNEFTESISLETQLLERVGSGDAFVAGILYKILQEDNLQNILDFGVGSATLKCTIPGDSMKTTAEDINAILSSTKNIIR